VSAQDLCRYHNHMNEEAVTLDDAFEVLQSFLQGCISEVQEAGAQAMRTGEYEAARQALAELERLNALLARTNDLEQEFGKLDSGPGEESDRLVRGKKTPQEAFFLPILESIAEMGGAGEVDLVLKRVYEKMERLLNDYDLAMLPSKTSVRWRNTAMWARFDLVKAGLLRNDSPRGVWEISEAGRRWLEEQEG